jgi:uncharacterized protein (TIGR02271 family)
MPTRKKKYNAVVGVFETRERAERAMDALKADGFEDVSLVFRNAEGKTVTSGDGEETYAEEGAAIGAVAGAAGGAAVGAALLTGLIPAIGPVLAIGSLGTILLNAAGGAAIAGIAGALIGWGIPEEDASFYENEVKGGRFLVTVEAGGRADEARTILHRFGGFDRTGWAAVRQDRANILAEGGFRDEAGRVIRLNEEQLRAHKETVRGGEVGVRKEVITEHKRIEVPVEREEIVIERRPVAGAAGAADIRAEEVRIPVKEERVHVSKDTVVKEEVNVGKRKVHDTKTVEGDVRREELRVETKGDAKVRHTAKKER